MNILREVALFVAIAFWGVVVKYVLGVQFKSFLLVEKRVSLSGRAASNPNKFKLAFHEV